jgi:type I restriction enzyme, R subunit
MIPSGRNEASTRADLIDVQLSRAGWSKNRRMLVEELSLQTAAPSGAYGAEQFADYVLLSSDGKPIAVVEAKRSARDELAGKRQAADYADALAAKFFEEPFIFLTNGKEIQFWDRGRNAPRKIAGFYTRDDLERLRHQRHYRVSTLSGLRNTVNFISKRECPVSCTNGRF